MSLVAVALTDELPARLGEVVLRDPSALVRALVDEATHYEPYRDSHISGVSLERSARLIVDLAVRALNRVHVIDADGAHTLDILARERAECGMPVDLLLDGFRWEQRCARERCVTLARAAGLRDAQLLDVLSVLIDVADESSARLHQGHRSLRTTHSGTLAERQVSMVRRLLWGTAAEPARRDELISLGLRDTQSYRAVWVQAPASSALMCSKLRSQGWHAGGGLVVELDGDVVGVLSQLPVLDLTREVVAVGDERPLTEAALSFRTAARIMDAADRFSLEGVVTADRLGLRLAIASDPAVSRVLADRYLRPLDDEGDFGGVLAHTAHQFLLLGGQVKRAARELHIHPNTLKHRLQRLEAITGCDVSDPRTIAELWWALESRVRTPDVAPEELDVDLPTPRPRTR